MSRTTSPVLILSLLAATVCAQSSSAIAWFGSCEAGREVAAQTGRPILLMSAAPQCHGVSGIW